jgi:hypothetical protein
MDSAVFAAFITAIFALVGVLVTSTVTWRKERQISERQERLTRAHEQTEIEIAVLQDQFETRRERERRQHDAEVQLNLHREPLLEAARDLAHRIRNIRERGFLDYLNSPDDHRREIAMLGTFYRLGKYWGTVERLYGTVNLLQFERNETTRDVAALLDKVGKDFASDRPEYGGRTLMIWREEQRAVAELMQSGSARGKTVIGFATFIRRYEADFAKWFMELGGHLRIVGVEESPRLEALQTTLEEFVKLLQTERAGSKQGRNTDVLSYP